MRMGEALREGERILDRAGVPEASLDAWYLLEHVTGISRALWLADKDRLMSQAQEALYMEMVSRRAGRIPLQHITGVQEFMGLEFHVNEHVLIPRQDTEVLVEEALELLKQEGKKGGAGNKDTFKVLDLCTGSGCILLSFLYYGKKENLPFLLEGEGADLSGAALETAKKNGESLGLDPKWTKSDLLEGIKGKYRMILSNPPYIPKAEILHLQPEVKDHDPRMALDGGEDGLDFYRRIARESRDYLCPGGHLVLEIGADQGKTVPEILERKGFNEIRVKKDLAGLDRVVTAVYDENVRP